MLCQGGSAIDFFSDHAVLFALVCSGVAVAYGIGLTVWLLGRPPGSERMQEIGRAVQEGAAAYLRRQYTTIAVVAIIPFLLLGFYHKLGWGTAVGFLIGAALSAAAGFIGMNVAVRSNMRTAEAAKHGLKPALNVAFRAGSVTGLLVVGLGLVAAAFSGGRTAKGGLITLGIVLSLALMVVAAEPWRGVEDGMGDRTYQPSTAAAVRPVYDQGIGDATLDLSRIDLSRLDGPIVTKVDGGFGDVEVLVPRSADVRVDLDSGVGTVDVLDLGSDGGYSPGSGAAWSGDDKPEIELTIDAGVGDLEVRRA